MQYVLVLKLEHNITRGGLVREECLEERPSEMGPPETHTGYCNELGIWKHKHGNRTERPFCVYELPSEMKKGDGQAAEITFFIVNVSTEGHTFILSRGCAPAGCFVVRYVDIAMSFCPFEFGAGCGRLVGLGRGTRRARSLVPPSRSRRGRLLGRELNNETLRSFRSCKISAECSKYMGVRFHVIF